MGNYTDLLYEKQRNGVLITLNRPESLNAINRNLQWELNEALDEAAADPEIRAIVLTGAGRAFSSGMAQQGNRRRDHVWPYGIPEGMSAAEVLNPPWEGVSTNFLHMWELGKPIISAVNGWCMGAGTWYALFCHMTIAADNAVFGQPEVRHGSGTNFIWTLLAGFKNALRYGLTGDHIDAQEALRIGLVNKVVPQEQLLEECFNIVERIAHVSPETVKINLHIATLGLEMMGFRDALLLGQVMPSPLQMQREEFIRPLNDALATGGVRAYLQLRDGPFQPEPFGPRSRAKE